MLCCLQVCLLDRYGNYADMFLKLLKDGNDEIWDVYFVFEKDSPPDEVLADYEVDLASCSQHAVYLAA
jgi:hypothetical protein